MTTKKVRAALTLVETKIEAFKTHRTRKSLEEAIEEIQEFNHSIGVLLWDEMNNLALEWRNKEDKHVQ